MDMDDLHALAQFPVAAIEATVGLAMIYRWSWAHKEPRTLDSQLTLLLALFMLAIAAKQSFWAVWGALRSADLFRAADNVRTHPWPIVNNVGISCIGLAVLARICWGDIGVRGYAGTVLVCACIYIAAWAV